MRYVRYTVHRAQPTQFSFYHSLSVIIPSIRHQRSPKFNVSWHLWLHPAPVYCQMGSAGSAAHCGHVKQALLWHHVITKASLLRRYLACHQVPPKSSHSVFLVSSWLLGSKLHGHEAASACSPTGNPNAAEFLKLAPCQTSSSITWLCWAAQKKVESVRWGRECRREMVGAHRAQ